MVLIWFCRQYNGFVIKISFKEEYLNISEPFNPATYLTHPGFELIFPEASEASTYLSTGCCLHPCCYILGW